MPDRILLMARDLRHALGCGPADLADPDRMREYALRLALAMRRKVVEAHGRHVDDDSLVRRIGQHEARGQHDAATGPGQPRIDAGIGAHDLLVADVKPA